MHPWGKDTTCYRKKARLDYDEDDTEDDAKNFKMGPGTLHGDATNTSNSLDGTFDLVQFNRDRFKNINAVIPPHVISSSLFRIVMRRSSSSFR